MCVCVLAIVNVVRTLHMSLYVLYVCVSVVELLTVDLNANNQLLEALKTRYRESRPLFLDFSPNRTLTFNESPFFFHSQQHQQQQQLQQQIQHYTHIMYSIHWIRITAA